MSSSFLKKLETGVFLGDGAMGTQLYERGVYVNRNYDDLNLSDSHLIKAIHRDYIQAGANIIETNTFGANPYKLGKHGLADKTFDINKTGAEIAFRCAAEGAGVLVAGSIGPFGKPIAPVGKITEKEALEAFNNQVRGLLAGDVDLFMLESFLDLHEIQIAIQAIRSQSDLPIVAMMTVDNSGLTAYGRTPELIAGALNGEPVDVIGLNCSTGPLTILEGIRKMREVTDKPLAAFPNAGEPKMVEGRIIYFSTPEYFAEYAKRMIQHGVSFIGGCCGTTPKHIRLMASAIRALQPRIAKVVTIDPVTADSVTDRETVQLAPMEDRSPLGKLLNEGKFPVSCELHPPRSPKPNRIIKQVKLLKKAGIDVVNIPDGPRASARMSPMALAHIIDSHTGMDTILHYTCRDRNILGIQSDLLGIEALGLSNILCVTGDPPKLGDYPMASAVYDVDAIGLVRIANNLNHSMDLAANPIPSATTFFLGVGFNPGAIDLTLEVERLHSKIESGAEYIMTQPVFDLEIFASALEVMGMLDVPIFVGILPLANFRNAEFFHNEVPGMEIPASIRERMRIASDKGKEHASAEGVAIAQEALSFVKEFVQGAYVMPPFGRVELAIETVSILPGRKSTKQINKEIEESS
ncbi:MAG: bifunctional homocysteine S-methyltransferase/methylenetetrahydrofolate reductase [Candidatus Electryonea clarkiae]|nr:bifunctional homocysteine S-methyltransferase/methylenetetrahydrofolate reductase [Candidatus Electryonea clarkiae]MDP8287467.1 bifunctional homocysteine S-methyltransferase/methylenetetrahydrofolate reductase [Candidatus Electryonea clarkiae]